MVAKDQPSKFKRKQVMPSLKDIGNAVSNIGGGAVEMERVVRALGQMLAKGRVSAEEMMQLAIIDSFGKRQRARPDPDKIK